MDGRARHLIQSLASLLSLALLALFASGCAHRPADKGAAAADDEAGFVATPPRDAPLAVGADFVCALAGDEVVCWGQNGDGQLGHPRSGRVAEPRPVPGTRGATEVVAGMAHACARLASAEVVCWGLNSLAQAAGRREEGRSRLPALVEGVQGAVQLAAGLSHTCALDRAGRVRCWGSDDYGQATGAPPRPSPAPRPGDLGGLGASDQPPRLLPPTEVEGLPAIASIAAESRTTCAVSVDGGVYCWGLTMRGTEETMQRRESIDDAVQVALGRDFRCALRRTGAVTCWGRDGARQVGDGGQEARAILVPIDRLEEVVQLASVDLTACARQASGDVSCWSGGMSGQLNLDGTRGSPSPTPRLMPELPASAWIEGDGSRFCALVEGDAVHCWGGPTEKQVTALSPSAAP